MGGSNNACDTFDQIMPVPGEEERTPNTNTLLLYAYSYLVQNLSLVKRVLRCPSSAVPRMLCDSNRPTPTSLRRLEPLETNLTAPLGHDTRHVSARQKHLSLQLDDLEGAPWVYSSGGVNQVRERAREEVDPAVMEEYGGYDVFPLLWTPFAENGNMLEPNEIAKRHYPCGDPRIVRAALN